MTDYFYGQRDDGPVGPVRDLQRALMRAGHALPKYGDDGDLGLETWQALGLGAAPLRGEEVPAARVVSLERVATRVVPITTKRGWPARGARAWLAERAEGARLHAGVDLGTTDDAVLAPEDCTVLAVIEASYGGRTPRFSRPAGWGGYGPFAVLLQSIATTPTGRLHLPCFHLLAHVDRVEVRAQAMVARGTCVAKVAAIGAHLHWEVRTKRAPTDGEAVVEMVLDPGWWLYGVDRRWAHGTDPCPRKPERSARTPRPCRPGGA